MIDVNAFLGHYPFRQLQFTDAGEMLGVMDQHGVRAAVVSSLHAVFYRDVQRGNDELFAQVQLAPDRIVPIAAVNPTYAGWQKDLEASIQQGARGMVLWPEHHGYRLDSREARSAVEQIARADLPLVLYQRLEDRRQRHHWDQAEDLKFADVATLAQDYPKLRILLSNWVRLKPEELLAAGLRGRCLVDLARLHVLLHKEVPKLIEALGVEALAYGSHMPFDYLGPSLVKMANLERLPKSDYERIASRNAAEFFGLAEE